MLLPVSHHFINAVLPQINRNYSAILATLQINRNYSAILATLQITSYALGV
jgi:hypothetical protein